MTQLGLLPLAPGGCPAQPHAGSASYHGTRRAPPTGPPVAAGSPCQGAPQSPDDPHTTQKSPTQEGKRAPISVPVWGGPEAGPGGRAQGSLWGVAELRPMLLRYGDHRASTGPGSPSESPQQGEASSEQRTHRAVTARGPSPSWRPRAAERGTGP